MSEKFDVIVVGSGSGMIIVSAAVEQGLKTALVENSRMGGTCINRGCVPSKMLIHPADITTQIKDAAKIGVNASVNAIDFKNIMTRMHMLVDEDSNNQAKAVEATKGLKWFRETGEFTSDYTMQVGSQSITAKFFFIVSGTRNELPPIKGIQNINYLTSDTVLQLETLPKSILIVGGGYIGVEYGHFFSGLGIKTTIIQRASRIIPNEEPEISDLLKMEMEKRMEIYTDFEVEEIKQNQLEKTIIAKNLLDGSLREFTADAVMIAAGRISNADLLKPEKTGVKLDEKGYIKVDDYLETSKKNIWAFGDAIGKEMFKHVANFEAGIAWHNAVHDHKTKMDFSAAPHAVFTYPQVASVGLKENEAKVQRYKILVGLGFYRDTAMGGAMGEPSGFVKAIVERETGKILGAHIIGAEASILIQEIVNAMAIEHGTFAPIARGMHIHPALSEVVQNAFGNLKPA